MKPLRRSARLNSAESAKGGMRMSSVAKASSNDEEEDSTSSTSLEEEEEETFDLAEYQRKDRERKDAMGRRQREIIEKRRREEEERKLNPVEPSATGSTFPTATLDSGISGESVETFDLEDYKRKDIEKHTARQREARKRAESRNAKELEDKAKPAEDLSSDSDSSDEDESDMEDTSEGKKAPGRKPSARKAPAVPYERGESLFAKQMELYKNDIPKELFSSHPKPPPSKRQQPQAESTSSRSTQGTSGKENKSAENGQQLSDKGKKKENEVELKKSSKSATRSSKQPNVDVEEDEETEMMLLPPETKIRKAKVPFPAHILAGRESMTSGISPSQNQGSFLTSTPSQKTVGLGQGQRQSIAWSPLPSAKEPKMGHLILTQNTHQVSRRLPFDVHPLPLRIETEEDDVLSDPGANPKSASPQAKFRASQSHSEVQAVKKQRLGRSSRASISQPVKNGTFDVPHGFGSAEPRIKRTPHGPRAATAEEKAAEEDNREEDVSEEEEEFPDEFPKTVSGSQNENERSFPPAAPTEEETEEVYTSKAQSSIVRTQDRNFTADLPLPAEDAEGASISRKAPRKQQKNEETFPVVAGPSTSPATVELATEKAPLPPKHAPRPRASKKGKEAPVIMHPTRKTKRDKGHPSIAAVFEEEEEEIPASKAQSSPVRPGERIQSQENLFQLSDDGTEGPSTLRQTVHNQQKKDENVPVAFGPSTSPAIVDGQNEEEEEEEVAEKPAKRGTRSRAPKKREGAPTVTLPTKKSKQRKALFPPEEPEVLGEPKHATSSKAPKKHDKVPVVKLPTIKSKRDKAKVPSPPVVEEEVEKEIEAPASATARASSVRRQEKALPKVSKQRKELKGKSKQDKVAPPPESEQDKAPASKVSKKRKRKPVVEVQSSKKVRKDKVPPPILEEMQMEIEDGEGDIVSSQTTDAMAKGRPSTSLPPKPSKITSASRRLRLESDSDKEEKAPEKPPKDVIRSKASGQRKVAPGITTPAKTSKKAPPPVVSEDEEEDDDEQEKVVTTSSKAKSSTTRPQERTLAQASDDDGERPSTSRQAIEMQQRKRKTSIIVAGPSTSQVSLTNISTAGSHVSRRPSIFQTLRESRGASVQPSTSAAAAKTTKKKGRSTAAVAPEETPERYVGNHVFGNYHMLKQEDFKEILNAQKPNHGLSSEQVEQMSLKVNHFLEDFFTFHCNETEHFYGFIPFLELKQALIDQCLLEEDCKDDDFLYIMKQNFTKEAWKKGEGILYPSRYDLKQTPDTNDYLYK